MISIRDGWLVAPYDGHDLATVEIGVGDPPEWRHAFLDYLLDGQRVAKIRPPQTTGVVRARLRVNGTETA